MVQKGVFKQSLGVIDLVLIGVGSIIGSSWLFAALFAAQVAGPAAWISWIIGAVASFFIALPLAELGSAIPLTGGLVRYPAYSHGPLIGYLMSFLSFIGYSSVSGLEAVAVRTYLSVWWPALGDSTPTVLGWFFQAALLTAFFLLNYWGVKTFGKVNTLITFIKFVVPLITIIVLFAYFQPENFMAHEFAPSGFNGVVAAVSTAGIIFAFLGFQNAVMFSSEVKNPSRTIPIAIFAALMICALIYALLQVSFIGAMPSGLLTNGWAGINMHSPFAELAALLGLGWLVKVLMADAVLSPSGTGNIYLSATARQIFAWSKNGTFFKRFTRVDQQTGVPRAALWLSFFMALFWTLPFPSWQALVQVNSAAGVLVFAMIPIAAASFRRTAPHIQGAFRTKWMGAVAPIAFIVTSFITFWVGWSTISWVITAMIIMGLIYCLFHYSKTVSNVTLSQQVKSTWWLLFYAAGMLLLSYLGTFGGKGILPAPWDQLAVAVLSLISYYWGVATAIPKPVFDEEEAVDELAS